MSKGKSESPQSSGSAQSPRSRVFEYVGGQLTVRWDLERCIHAAACVKGSAEVFDPDRKPWIDPDRADADVVREVVLSCPSGALHYEDHAGEDPSGRDQGLDGEPVPEVNSARGDVNGPLYVEGDLLLDLPDGREIRENRVALCRCGASSNKPLCDNSHLESGFEDPGHLAESRLGDEPADGGQLSIRCAPNGPLLVRGPMTLRGPEGEDQSGTRGALCRCGASSTKPYCDGSHVGIGFSAD